MLSKALGAYWDGLLSVECEREADFQEMFSMLGNAEGQNDLRLRNDTKKHCKLLADNPSACLRCPAPENPYRDDGKHEKVLLARTLLDNLEAVEYAMQLLADVEIGVMNKDDILGLVPEDFMALSIARQQEHVRMAKIQGNIIAVALAQCIGGGGAASE